LLELAEHATVPVVNGLTRSTHPCQVMADVMTFEEKKGSIQGCIVAWLGDANNVATSWVHAAARFGFTLRLACPKKFKPGPELIAWAENEGASLELGHDPQAAARGADCVVTDVWVSMADGEDKKKRKNLLKPFQVDGTIMGSAKPDAIFMHCLPAHRGDEVTAEVIDGPQSVVWDEAENRLHVQKAILAWCLGAAAADTARTGAGEVRANARLRRVERAGAK
jgi:ornithine carbamoyltransferase